MKLLCKQLLSAFIVSAILLIHSGVACADHHDEITHLLEFMAQSDCTFIRNGKEYSGPEARDHIAGKYDYVKWRIKNTETFVRKIASRSSLSGEQYMIQCGEKGETTEQWLMDELTSYRNPKK